MRPTIHCEDGCAMWKTNWTTRATAAMIMAAYGASLAIAPSTAPADVIKQRQQSLKNYERGDFRSAGADRRRQAATSDIGYDLGLTTMEGLVEDREIEPQLAIEPCRFDAEIVV